MHYKALIAANTRLGLEVGHHRASSLIKMGHGSSGTHHWWTKLFFDGKPIDEAFFDVREAQDVPIGWEKYAAVDACEYRRTEMIDQVEGDRAFIAAEEAAAAADREEFEQRFGYPPAPASKIAALLQGGWYIKDLRNGQWVIKRGGCSERVFNSVFEVPESFKIRPRTA